jgi:hypothetical protein
MSSCIASEKGRNLEPDEVYPQDHVEIVVDEKHLERVPTPNSNLVYDHDEDEPELHLRTYFALAAMFLLNLVQVLALQAPPAVVRNDYGANP